MLLGHREILKDLENLAAKGSLGQSYLFFGPSMVGKRTAALAFARFLEKGTWEAVHEGEILQDAKVIDLASMREWEADTKDSIGIGAAREAQHFLWQRPAVSSRRTLIIDDAEMLTTEAQNALLKVTEEPPASSLLIFITSDPEAILPTILSRVQKIYFGPIKEAEIGNWILDIGKKKLDEKKAMDVAKKSLGKPGLAWRLLFDEELQERLARAENFLKLAGSPSTTLGARREFIKDLIEPDDFRLRQFLAAVALTLAWFTSAGALGKPSAKRVMALWHKTLALQDAATHFGLNPRLQLENLLM